MIGVLRRDEGQGPIVERYVDDYGAGDGVGGRHVAGPRQAHAAFGVKHAALLGAERKHLAVDVPVAARPQERRRRRYVGKVQGEATHEGPVRAVQLDGRRQAKSGQIGLAPHRERRVGGRGAVRRPEDVGRQGRTSEQCIHLPLGPGQTVEQRSRMTGGRRGDLFFYQPLLGGQPVVHDGRVGEHRGYDERPEDGRELSGFGRMAEPGTEARRPQRHADHAGEQGEIGPGRNHGGRCQQQARRRCPGERPDADPVHMPAPAGLDDQEDGYPQPDGCRSRQQQTQQQTDPGRVQRVVRPLQQVGQ